MTWFTKFKNIETLIREQKILENELKKTRNKIGKITGEIQGNINSPYPKDWKTTKKLGKELKVFEQTRNKLESEFNKLLKIIGKKRILAPAGVK